jgi:uncharacterized RDD family membrane protein YckC
MPSPVDTAAVSNARCRLSPTEALDRAERERWRREVISRVQQHRARRHRFDSSVSLDLEFPAEEETILDSAVTTEQAPALPPQDDGGTAAFARGLGHSSSRSRPLKIIRFPRQSPLATTSALQVSPPDTELADPVPDTPRILDEPEAPPVAEQMDLMESFSDISLEPSPGASEEVLPPQPAPLWQRSLSASMDFVIVLAATLMFAATFLKLASPAPASRPAALYALVVTVMIWLIFQYLFLVHGRGTPGMRAIGLELRDFGGRSVSRFARRCRALATVLSGLSLGLGFAWSFVDEDTLGWHDRMSGTYLRSGDRLIG